MNPNLTPEALKALKQMRDDLAKLRRSTVAVIEEVDHHVAIVVRLLNDRADWEGVNKATRHLYRAMRNQFEAMEAWSKTYIRSTPKVPANESSEPLEDPNLPPTPPTTG